MYCAVIGDIISSKTTKDRNALQETLKTVLEQINHQYSDAIASNFTITLGDEFQGLLNDVKNLTQILTIIKDALHPVKVRFGIGIGEMYTGIIKTQSLGADGPAYYAARDAVTYLKENQKKYEAEKRYEFIKIYDQANIRLDLINASLMLCTQIENDWTDRQREIVILMKHNNNSQKQAADILGINKSNINRSLSSSKYYNYTHTMDTIQLNINQLWEDINA